MPQILLHSHHSKSIIIYVDTLIYLKQKCTFPDSTESLSSNSTVTATAPVAPNGLTRSRRSHFSLKDTTGEINRISSTSEPGIRIVHKYERLLHYAKSPHSWALPNNWTYICDNFPNIIRNKVIDTTYSSASSITSTSINNNIYNQYGSQSVNNRLKIYNH